MGKGCNACCDQTGQIKGEHTIGEMYKDKEGIEQNAYISFNK